MTQHGSQAPSILIISSKKDTHVTPVADVLDAHDINWARLNTEDLARNAIVNVDPGTGDGVIRLLDSGKVIELSKIRAVWYRKPDPVDVSHLQVDLAVRDYVEAEFREVHDGLYAFLSRPEVFWINNPFFTRLSHRKLLQLRVASRLGFNIPKTILTNDPKEAFRFADTVGWDIAVKSLGALSVTTETPISRKVYGIFTRRINEVEFKLVAPKLVHMPTLIQEYVSKEFELRITCVGRRVFACAIYSQQDPACAEDSRINIQEVRHEIRELPELTPLLLAYLDHFGLNFGCFDFAVTPQGEYVFFECNPNGQFLWIENLTGAPISTEVANLLMSRL